MIQVLGLRDYAQNGVSKKRETFFSKGWRFQQIQDVFNPEKLAALLAEIPKEEHFNLYFTVADCFEEPGRKLKEQWAIPFDIDDLLLEPGAELQMAERAARAGAEVLGVAFEEMAVTYSGNGVQFFVLLAEPILADEFFESTRAGYGLIVKKIQNKLIELGIQGTVDPSVWSKGRLMRLPETLNRKPGKPERLSRLLNGAMVPQPFDIVEFSGIKETIVAEHISDAVLKNYPKPDTKAICVGCKFLVHCKDKPNEVSEPQWYAMTSVTSRLDDGRALTHQYSEGYAKYNHYETENKIDQALESSGPRTCKSIDTLWGECNTCDYFGKVTSPIMIKGDNYIASADFGYRERRSDKDGNVRAGKPAYQDLVKAFTEDHPYQVVKDNKAVIVFNGKHWEFLEDIEIEAWMMMRVKHAPSVAEMRELVGTLKAFNVTSMDKLFTQKDHHMNFRNCVLNMQTMQVAPHAPQYGFFNVLPFDYNPRAVSPLWDKFLLDIMEGDAERVELLKEFGGYCISGDTCWLQKAMLLVGDGANGKSVFMEMLGEVVGRDSHSAIPLQTIESATVRYSLINKLFNYSEETSINALAESSTFKNIVAGGVIQVKKLYSNEFDVVSTAKVMMAANNMPHSTDKSHGFMRRMAIVHFDARFEPGDGKHDYFIKDKLKLELAGICNGLIAAYQRLKTRGYLAAQEKLAAAIREYQEETDTVLMFKIDCVEFIDDMEKWVRTTEVYDQYKAMCDLKGFKPTNDVNFAKQLKRHDKTFEQRKDRIRVDTGRVSVYRGIKLHKEF